MKKETRNRLMAISVLLIMSLSSIGYVFSSFGKQQDEVKQLTGYVVTGDIDPRVEQAYMQNGFTFLKLYYNSTLDFTVLTYIEQAPSNFVTTQGQTQLIVQKIENPKNYARIVNVNVDTELDDLTQESVYNELCTSLLVLPTECALFGLNLSS